MIHLAWMLLLFAASPDCVADALPDCRPAQPATVAVAITDPVEHHNQHGGRDLHDEHATLRSAYGQPAVYLGGGLAAVVAEPPLRLSDVARAVPREERGPAYHDYLVKAQRWWERHPTNLLEEQACYIAGTAWHAAHGNANDVEHSAKCARELSRYATVLLRLARALPGYDARQLAAIVEYQWMRVGSLPHNREPGNQSVGSSSTGCQLPPSSAGAKDDTHDWHADIQADEARQRILPGPESPDSHPQAQKRPAPADDFVIVWTASWCGSCKTYLPLWTRLRSRGVKVYELDVDNPPADWAHLRPATVPQVRVYRGGKRVGMWSGAGFEKAIEAILDTK